MTSLHTLLRAAMSTGLIATAALSGAAHADTSGEIAKFDAKTNRYCVTRMITGSLLSHRTCATREEWAQMGNTVTQSRTRLAAK